MTAESPLVGWEVRFKRTYDLANGRMRTWQSNRSLFPARFDLQPAGGARYVNALDGDIAFTLPADGSMMGAWADSNPDGFTSIGSTWGIGIPERPATMDAWRTNYPGAPTPQRVFGAAAVTRRLDMLQHPLTLMRAILNGAQVSNHRTESTRELVDVVTAKGDKLTLAVDRATKLPASVSRMDGNNYWGDVVLRTTFASYEEVSGLKLPRRLSTTLDRFFQTDFRVTWNTLDGDIGDLAAPASMASATPPPAAPPSLVVAQVPGVNGIWKIWVEQGEIRPDARPDTNATCLLELSDHMVLFDVPGFDPFVQAVIDKAKELRPGKPITQLILSHFDPGHTAGLRAGVAAGMELITYKANVTAFTEVVNRKHTINPDTLAKNPKPLKITSVDDSYVIKDSLRELQLYHKIGDGESATMIMAYSPRDRVLVNTDAWNVITEQTPNDSDSPSMYDNIVKRRLDVARHVPLHSIGMPTQAEFMKQLEYTRSMEYQFFRLAQRLRIDSQF
jgi:hypothetical protein